MNQRAAIELLVNELKKSYTMPVQTLGFPFLLIEFKGLGASGSPFKADNQACNAGAIAMNGLLELYRRNSAETDMDFDHSQCFSITVNYSYVSVNVHWLSHSAEDGSICFHMASLSKHLTVPDGLKLVQKIVRNILDYAVSKQLPKICEALDTYRQNIVDEREKAIHVQDPASEPQGEEQQLPPRQSGGNSHPSADRQPAKRRKLGGPAHGDITEGDVDGPAEQSQSRRATRSKTNKAPPSVRQKERRRRNSSSAVSIRASSRIAQARKK